MPIVAYALVTQDSLHNLGVKLLQILKVINDYNHHMYYEITEHSLVSL